MNFERAHSREYARRVNQAMDLLAEAEMMPADVARELARQHGVSERQGWRYVREAAGRSRPLDVPEQKVVFTVKVPQSVVARVRAVAAAQGQTLSTVVTRALEELLWRHRAGGHGGAEKS